MALATDEPTMSQPPVATSCGLEDSPAPSSALTTQSEARTEGLKTIRLLKEWPLVTNTANKAQQLYESLKTKSRLFNWSCALAENTVHAVYQRSTVFLPVVHPAIRLADFAASQVAEAVQKQLPLVRQPTSQVSEAVTSKLSSLVAPLSATVGSVFRIGKRRTRNATKRVVRIYKKLIVAVDKWMDEVEKYIENTKSKETDASQMQQAGARSLKRRALDVAATAAVFYVGASFWLLCRLPLIGAYLQHIPSPSSSKSASPLRDPEPQPSQPTESGAEAETTEVTQEQRVKPPFESEAVFQKGTV